MDLDFTPVELKFRDDVRAWIAGALPANLKAKADVDGHFEPEEVREWHRILAKQGWAAPYWPVKYGGPDFDPTRRFILSEELELSGAPMLSPFGIKMVGPLLMQFGTEAQQQRFLPKILSGDEVWCQGYSEPGAGSDLASLQTRAEDDGTHWVLNGQKTWTTYAHFADWMFVLARTGGKEVKKQDGISFFLVDMKTPGVTPRPMLTTAGLPSFCDTFLENVKVPKENLVGPLNGGWTVAKSLLGHERTHVLAVGVALKILERVKRIAKEKGLDRQPAFSHKIATLEVKLRTLQLTVWRTLASAQLGKAPGPESSILKIRCSELIQTGYELAMELMGPDAIAWFNEAGVIPEHEQWVASNFHYSRATTIYAGSNEIQKNIIAKAILELPSR